LNVYSSGSTRPRNRCRVSKSRQSTPPIRRPSHANRTVADPLASRKVTGSSAPMPWRPAAPRRGTPAAGTPRTRGVPPVLSMDWMDG
jgi:hypothetical protein